MPRSTPSRAASISAETALAAFHFDPVKVNIGGFHQAAVNGGVRSHNQRGVALVVPLLRNLVLIHDREGADEEALVFTQTVAGAEPESVRAEGTVRGQLQPHAEARPRLDGLFAAVVANHRFDGLDRLDGDARLVKQDLARLIEVAAGEVHLDGRPLLPAGRRQPAQARNPGKEWPQKGTKRHKKESNRTRGMMTSPPGIDSALLFLCLFVPFCGHSFCQPSRPLTTSPPLMISIGRPPGAISSLSALMPSWWYTVVSTSSTRTGFSSGSLAVELDEP